MVGVASDYSVAALSGRCPRISLLDRAVSPFPATPLRTVREVLPHTALPRIVTHRRGRTPVGERSPVYGWISLVSTHPAVLLPACDPAARPSLGRGSVVPLPSNGTMPGSDSLSAGWHPGRGGPLQFPNGLSLHSTSSTPEGSWRLHFPGLHRFHGLRRLEPSSAPSAPPVARRVPNDAADFASCCGLQVRSPPQGRLCQRASTAGFRPPPPLSYSAAGTLPRPDSHWQAPWSLSGHTSSAALPPIPTALSVTRLAYHWASTSRLRARAGDTRPGG
jgi:hypothetical protein